MRATRASPARATQRQVQARAAKALSVAPPAWPGSQAGLIRPCGGTSPSQGPVDLAGLSSRDAVTRHPMIQDSEPPSHAPHGPPGPESAVAGPETSRAETARASAAWQPCHWHVDGHGDRAVGRRRRPLGHDKLAWVGRGAADRLR